MGFWSLFHLVGSINRILKWPILHRKLGQIYKIAEGNEGREVQGTNIFRFYLIKILELALFLL